MHSAKLTGLSSLNPLLHFHRRLEAKSNRLASPVSPLRLRAGFGFLAGSGLLGGGCPAGVWVLPLRHAASPACTTHRVSRSRLQASCRHRYGRPWRSEVLLRRNLHHARERCSLRQQKCLITLASVRFVIATSLVGSLRDPRGTRDSRGTRHPRHPRLMGLLVPGCRHSKLNRVQARIQRAHGCPLGTSKR